MLNREVLHRRYTLFAMLVLAICGCYSMRLYDGEENFSVNIAIIYLATFAVLLPGMIPYLRLRAQQNVIRPIKWIGVLMVWMAMVSLVYAPGLKPAIYQCLCALIPLATMTCMYAYSAQYGMDKRIYWMVFVMQCIFIIQYAQVYNVMNLIQEAHLMTSYYPLFILPLVLLLPSKAIRYTSIALIVIVIFSSLKRGGLVALTVGLLAYIFCSAGTNKRNLKSFIWLIVALGILGVMYFYIANSEFGGVINRLTNIGDDGGSGRTRIWRVTWQMIQRSGFMQQLVGHGFNGVIDNSPILFSAHNDFLEVWYDYGLVGAGLYVGTILSLIRYTLRLIREKAAIAPPMAMMLGIMLVLSMISIVVTSYFMVLCCLVIGFLAGQDKYNKQHLNTE